MKPKGMSRRVILWIPLLAGFWLLTGMPGPISVEGLAVAGSKSKYSSKSSYSRKTWGRSSSSKSRSSAAPRYSSGGYSKPVTKAVPPSRAGASSSSGVAKTVPNNTAVASGGYKKPGAKGVSSSKSSSPPVTKPASSGAYSKPPSKAQTATKSTSSTSGGYKKPAVPISGKAAPPGSAMDRKISRKQSAQVFKQRKQSHLKARTEEVNRVRSSRDFGKMAGSRSYDRDSVLQARNVYYRNRDSFSDRHRGSRIFDYERSYGGYDNRFLMDKLHSRSNPGSSKLWYALAGAAGTALFLSDTKEQALASGDRDLLARVEQVEGEVARLESSGVPRPSVSEALEQQKIPAEVALREEVLTGQVQRTALNFGTGTEGGVYHAFCDGMETGGGYVEGFKRRAAALDTHCRETGGSEENLAGFAAGELDAILVQADTADVWLRKHAQKELGPFQMPVYQEPFWLLVNEDGDIDSVEDLDAEKHTLYLGPSLSGAGSSWKNLAHHVQENDWTGKERYTGFTSKQAGYLAGAGMVALDPANVMLMVMGTHSRILQDIEEKYGKQLKLVPIEDDSFLDVKDREDHPVYRSCTIPGGSYPELQHGWVITSVDTLCVDTLLVLSSQWVEKNGMGAESAFVEAASLTIPGIRRLTDLD